MRRFVVSLLLIIAGALAAWLLWPERPRGSPIDGPAGASVPSSASASTELPATQGSRSVKGAPRPIVPVPFVEAAPATRPAPEGLVFGQVVDALGDPIHGADVWIVQATDEAERGRTRTAADGTFRLEHLPLTGMQVRATAPTRYVGNDQVSLNSDQPVGSAYIRLWDTGKVTGRVVDGRGGPIVGATVIASSNGSRALPFTSLAEARSGADGRFELPHVPLGSLWIRAVAPGHGVGGEIVQLRGAADVLLRLGEGGVEIAVRVTGLDDPSGSPVRVQSFPYDGGTLQILPTSLVRGFVDKEGRWGATGLPDLEYTIFVSADGWSFQPAQRALKRGAPRHEVAFQAIRNGAATLRGTLRDEAGNPLAGETIQCRSNSVRDPGTGLTASDGSFAIPLTVAPATQGMLTLIGSRFVLSQKKEPGRPEDLDLRSRGRYDLTLDPAVSVDLCAIPAVRVRGRVVTTSGSAVSHSRITLQNANTSRMPRWWMDFAYGQTQADGRFEFAGLHEVGDEIRASVVARDGAGTSETFKITRGADIDDIAVVLAPAATIDGTVRNHTGEPIPGARVWLMNWDLATNRQRDGTLVETLTDRHGRYRHVGVEPGGHWLECFLERSQRRAHESKEKFDVAPGARLERDLVIPEG